MGVLNVTPDSFSDGGKFNRLDLAKSSRLNFPPSLNESGVTFRTPIVSTLEGFDNHFLKLLIFII